MADKKCAPMQVKVHRCVSVLPNDYSLLVNLPTINGKTIIGELNLEDIGGLSAAVENYETGSAVGSGKYLLVLDDSGAKKVDINEIKSSGGALQVRTRQELPPIGGENCVYFVTSENATYRWDNDSLRYIACGRDYSEIKIINGGKAD